MISILANLTIFEHDKILVIAPHPDDECIGPGGLLARYASQCNVVVLTDGDIGQGEILQEGYKHIRKQEFLDEMAFIGVNKYTFMDISDGMLMHHLDCMQDYILQDFTKIFVTGEKDGHSDHTAAMECLIRALKKQNKEDAQVYLYEIHNSLQTPTHYLDITDVMKQKQEMIRCHASQLSKVSYDTFAEISASYRGYQNRMQGRYLEVYEQVKDFSLNKELFELENSLQKFKQFYSLTTKWLMHPEHHIPEEWLHYNQVDHCVIYGYAELGKILEQRLYGADISVDYILDQSPVHSEYGTRSCFPGEETVGTDTLVIVTAVYYYDAIREQLQHRGYTRVVSLKEIIEQSVRM